MSQVSKGGLPKTGKNLRISFEPFVALNAPVVQNRITTIAAARRRGNGRRTFRSISSGFVTEVANFHFQKTTFGEIRLVGGGSYLTIDDVAIGQIVEISITVMIDQKLIRTIGE
uniref:Uncharacterized protein n=1 Tax=Romanomermis culicivorax TaxID=13658 RepID=A0A915KVW7_ROMCU